LQCGVLFNIETPLLVDMSLRDHAHRLWERHRTWFWIVHSVWSLITGTAIVVLARDRYHLVVWVVLFLALTWMITLFFGRAAADPERPPPLAHELTSYVTRVLYQETLFFLIPFYAASTVFRSLNALFLALLAGLAVLSCIDLVFDRWLRFRPVFGLMFFSIVAFAAVNLLLPLLVGFPPRFAAPAAALLSVGGVVPLGLRAARRSWRVQVRLLAAAALLVAVAAGLPRVIPPVPLRLQRATFATGIDRDTLALAETAVDHALSAELGGSLFVLVEVFAPSALPASVRLEWRRDGELLRVSRDISITAHAAGFRVWDGWHAPSGSVPPGRYRVVLQTAGGRVFGVATLTVDG
jgi:hypothetical protein